MSQEIHYFNSEFDFTSEIFFNEGIEVGKVREKNLIQVPTRYKIPSFYYQKDLVFFTMLSIK